MTPRYVCATARLDGYKTQTKCDYVSAGEEEYNSIGLEPGDDAEDAGVPDASTSDGPAGDPPVSGDGNPIDGGGGGCCQTGSVPTSYPLLVALVAWMLGRRRGTKSRRG